ncbi:MAG: hypothetical protein ACE5PV_07245, partial [Candidatus Poribacteria bacterium]
MKSIFLGKSILIVALLFIMLATEVARAEYQIVFTQEPYKREAENRSSWAFRKSRPQGSRIVVLSPDGAISVLTPEFASACDPSVSYDGKRILFAGKRTRKERWNIWEMDIDGKNKRQITKDFGDCAEPEYMARGAITPPEFTDKVRWIVFTSNASGAYDEHGGELATSLYAASLEPIEGRGFVTWRTTFNLSSDFSPTMLRDGRVLFSSWQHHGSRYYPNGMVALLTMNWAGTGLNPFYGNHEGPTVKSMACEMPDGTVVFIESDGSTVDGSGQLARVSFKRPLHSHEILSRGTGRYRTPHPFPNGELAVSYTSGADRKPKASVNEVNSFGIYLFDYETGEPGRKIYDDPEWNDVDAIPITPRPEPMGRITIVVDSLSTGFLQCLNVYDSDRPEAAEIRHGDVKRVRFVEGVPISQSERAKLPLIGTDVGLSGPGSTPIGATPFIRTRILGEAPVGSDGSFFVEVAADTPFFIQTLDENGMALQTMRGWMWVRRGSRRGCIGCHENKELAPENRVTDALIKAKPQSLTAPPEERRTVDFLHDVMPIIERRCVSCHDKDSPPKGLKLSKEPTKYFNAAYENLLTPEKGKSPKEGGKYIHPGNAKKSQLIHLIYGWERKTMPPDKSLSDEER